MSVSLTHALQQGPCIGTLLGAFLSSVFKGRGRGDAQAPGPEYRAELKARRPELLSDYIIWTGGDIGAYAGTIPPHLFPQWGLPFMAKALKTVPWPLANVMNQGCRLEVRSPLAANEPLHVQAHLAQVDVEPHRARMTTRILTGTAATPEAIVADMHAVVPLKAKENASKRPRPTVPDEANILAMHALTPRSGLDFALLTGDFNPIHWVSPYAKMAGFRSTILHGFASLALAWEDVVQHHLGGDPNGLTMMDVRFVRPLHLPADVGVFLSLGEHGENQIHVGAEPGGDAYMIGTFETRGEHE